MKKVFKNHLIPFIKSFLKRLKDKIKESISKPESIFVIDLEGEVKKEGSSISKKWKFSFKHLRKCFAVTEPETHNTPQKSEPPKNEGISDSTTESDDPLGRCPRLNLSPPHYIYKESALCRFFIFASKHNPVLTVSTGFVF